MAKRRLATAFCFFLIALIGTSLFAKQMVPDKKRQAEIRKALIEHGYKAGKTWSETQEILRGIAKEHHWQHIRAPDARVLILLGLGNQYSDIRVTLPHEPTTLDKESMQPIQP